MLYAPAKFDFATSNGLEDMHLQKKKMTIEVAKVVAQYMYPLHHVNYMYAPAKFKVASSNVGKEEMHLQEKMTLTI